MHWFGFGFGLRLDFGAGGRGLLGSRRGVERSEEGVERYRRWGSDVR